MSQRNQRADLRPDQQDAPCPCADATTPTAPPVAEWIPLDEVVEAWARLASQPYTSEDTIALHVIGEAFAALALEHSARSEYALAICSQRAQSIHSSSRDLATCLQDLEQAVLYWSSIAYWLPRLDQTPVTFIEQVRIVADLTRQQSRRLTALLQRVQDEQRRRLHGNYREVTP